MAKFSNMSDADFTKQYKAMKGKDDAKKLAVDLGFSDKGGLFKMSEASYAGNVIWTQASCDNGPFSTLIDKAVSLNGFGSGKDNFLLGFQSSVSASLVPVAYAIALIFFIIALVELGMSERMNIDSFTKFFARLVVGIFMIDNCQKFLDGGQAVADWMGDLIDHQGGAGGSSMSAKSMFNAINSMMPNNGFERAMNSASNGIFSFFQFIPLLLILTTLLSRLMEMCIRGALMPIAFSFATEEGWRGTAVRYFKRYIALLAMGPLIKVVFSMAKVIQAGINSSIGDASGVASFIVMIFVNMAIGLGEVGMIKKLQSVVSEAFGA